MSSSAPALKSLVSTALLLWAVSASAAERSPYEACYQRAGARYGVSADLLRAVAIVESAENPKAINQTHLERTGSVDIGLMQINSRHLGALAKQGISQRDLYQPCISVNVGAWLLRDLIGRYGSTWRAVGAYNASCTQLKADACTQARLRYVSKVQRALSRLAHRSSGASPQNKLPLGRLQALRFDNQGAL